MKYSLQVILVYLTVFIDSVGNSIVYPIIPFLAKELGGSEQELGVLYSSYSLTQTFSMSNMHLGGRAFILSLRCRRLCDGLSFWYIWTKALPCTEFIRFLGRYKIDYSQRGELLWFYFDCRSNSPSTLPKHDSLYHHQRSDWSIGRKYNCCSGLLGGLYSSRGQIDSSCKSNWCGSLCLYFWTHYWWYLRTSFIQIALVWSKDKRKLFVVILQQDAHLLFLSSPSSSLKRQILKYWKCPNWRRKRSKSWNQRSLLVYTLEKRMIG